MGVIPNFSADEFARMLVRLLPPGRLLTAPGDTLYKVLLANGDELARVQQRQIDLLEESDPRTTSELLPEWEAQYQITDTSGTEDERRARLLARVLSRYDFSARPADYQRVLAPLLDLDPSQVEVIEVDAATAALAGRPRLVYKFYIYRDPTLPGTPDLETTQAEVNRLKHSHTSGVVIESKSFKTDDPNSLTDRDILGL